MEREQNIDDLLKSLSNLHKLEDKGWKVDTAIEKIEKQLEEKVKEHTKERLAELRQELNNERKG